MKHDKVKAITAVRCFEELAGILKKGNELQYTRLRNGKSIRLEIYRAEKKGFCALAYTKTLELNDDIEEALYATWREIVINGLTVADKAIPSIK